MSLPAARLFSDAAGGQMFAGGSSTVFVNGLPLSLMGALVWGHGENEHAAPYIMFGSNTVFANNKPVCKMNDTATCGHTIISSSNTFIG